MWSNPGHKRRQCRYLKWKKWKAQRKKKTVCYCLSQKHTCMGRGGILPGNTEKSGRQNVCVLRRVQELNLWEFYIGDNVAGASKVFVPYSSHSSSWKAGCCSVSQMKKRTAKEKGKESMRDLLCQITAVNFPPTEWLLRMQREDSSPWPYLEKWWMTSRLKPGRTGKKHWLLGRAG